MDKSSGLADDCRHQDCPHQNHRNSESVTDSFRQGLPVTGAVQDFNTSFFTLKHNTLSEQAQNIFRGRSGLKSITNAALSSHRDRAITENINPDKKRCARKSKIATELHPGRQSMN